jgi:hypothetical protein
VCVDLVRLTASNYPFGIVKLFVKRERYTPYADAHTTKTKTKIIPEVKSGAQER